MKYLLYMKSHCEYPDLEDEIEAETKEEAKSLLEKRYGNWIRETDIASEDEWMGK